MSNRINWDDYFFKIVNDISLRSTCISRKVGAILVKDNRILSTGYNGSVKNSVHCLDINECKRKKLKIKSGTHAEICKGVHAEQNTIIQCAKYGVSTINSIMYCNCSPCSICLKMIINADIIKIKFQEYYNDELAIEIARESGYVLDENKKIIIKENV